MKRKSVSSFTTAAGSGGPETGKEEDLRHPSRVWAEPDFEHESLERLLAEYKVHLRGRPKPASPDTIRKYDEVLTSLIRSLRKHDDPVELGSLSVATVTRWIGDQRAAGRAEEGIANRLTALKAFSRT
jgi:site-specific recombinase XerC